MHDFVAHAETNRTNDGDDIDLEYASAVAERAHALMAKHSVPPTPENYATWFQYSLGTWQDFNKTIDVIASSRQPFDKTVNRSLYAVYQKQAQQSDSGGITARLQSLIDEARSFLGTASEENRAHVKALGGVTLLAKTSSQPLTIMAALINELSSAITRASKLEDKLVTSTRELDEIRYSLYRAEQKAQTDALTGLANRHALDQFVRRVQLSAMESGDALSILTIDIDHFKQFNDRFGHQIGDQVLRLIGQVLKENTSDQDLAARYGGEEMVVVLPKADINLACKVAELIRHSIAERPIVRRGTGEFLAKITVSVGVAQFDPGETINSLFERCDQALYQAKATGRDRTVSERDIAADVVAA